MITTHYTTRGTGWNMEILSHEKGPTFRVATGDPQSVVAEVNALQDWYHAINWTWSTVDGKLVLAVLMVHSREMRKAALAMGNNGGFKI